MFYYFFFNILSNISVGSIFCLNLTGSCVSSSDSSLSPISRSRYYPITSVPIFLSLFSPAPPSPSLSCPRIPRLITCQCHFHCPSYCFVSYYSVKLCDFTQHVARWLGLATGGPGRFRIPLRQLRFGTLAIPFTPLCQCLLEETLKAVGPFYLVSMPGDVKDPTSQHWNV